MIDRQTWGRLFSALVIVSTIVGAAIIFWMTLDEDMKRSVIYRLVR